MSGIQEGKFTSFFIFLFFAHEGTRGIHPLKTMNVCTMSVVPVYLVDAEILHKKSKKFDLPVVLEKKVRGFLNSVDFILTQQ